MDGALESRLLVLAPTGRDGPLTCDLLQRSDLRALSCPDFPTLCSEIERGCAGIMLAEEVMRPATTIRLMQLLNAQDAWSDLPIIVFTGEGTTHPGLTRLLRALGNVTVLDRPVRPVTMISSARAALRARRHQYEARAALELREAAVEQRDRFLAMLGHELRNPLAAVRLALDLLEPTPEQQRQLDVIARQSANLGRLIDDLLDVARVTSGKVVLQRCRLDLATILDGVVAALRPSACKAAVELSWERPATIWVEGDRLRLEQVFSNVLANAIKYTPRGGHVTLWAQATDGEAVVTVRDDGAGMARETLGEVFELFSQAHGTLDRAQGGLGIGLTVARGLVELHGGRITATSDGIDRGSTFVATLPLAASIVDTDEAMTSGPQPVPNKRHVHRILVIEDSDDIRDLTCMLLASYGHNVSEASDGNVGLTAALADRPDVALVDIGLPGIDGFEVARRIRAELGDDIVLIALSGYGQTEDARKAREAGFDLHLVKPVDTAHLRKLLATERSQLRAAVQAQATPAS
ncbi:MAG: ATP-binding protein [Polyangia bacterium]